MTLGTANGFSTGFLLCISQQLIGSRGVQRQVKYGMIQNNSINFTQSSALYYCVLWIVTYLLYHG